ncbi:MAG TPA: hypothetical protein VFE62_00780, partial [Gemmataceae bacterium]|nr:hypothetical protein [Gemmataceae bacterium]
MVRAKFVAVLALIVSCSFSLAQNEAKPKFVPGPFECFNINGKAKGRPHCLVCKFALNPVVLIFTKEPAAGKDGPLNDLLEQLDKLAALPDFAERDLSIGVVFLSPDAKDSTNNAEEEKSEELLKEAINREMLRKRLEERAKPFKKENDADRVIVAYYPLEGPKKYNIDPKMEQTI